MVFDIGDQVFGWGQILRDEDGFWFDPPHPIGMGFGREPARTAWSVRLLGHDPLKVATEL